MRSTMSVNLKRGIFSVAAVAILFLLWHIGAVTIGNSFILPGVADTFNALFRILKDSGFLPTVLLTLSRVMLGLILGIVLGSVLGFVAHKSLFMSTFIGLFITIVKSTPIASIIILLWLMLGGNALAIFVTILMVFPIISENVIAGLNNIDPALSEVCDIYNVKGFNRFKILVFPSVFRYIVPAMITSAGLAWKAEVAAEIIGYVSKSVGSYINDAKSNFDTDEVFAWTMIVVVFSVLIEHLTKLLLRRIQRNA